MSRILMVSAEYPPMQGGVGRYTFNLTKALRNLGFEVKVVSNKLGSGEFSGLSAKNPENSNILLEIVERTKPDLVHVQYEPGLYGIMLDPLNPRKTSTNIDLFYNYCQTPIVTTFHSAYPFKQWLSLITSIKDSTERNRLSKFSKNAIRYWKMFLNYYSFHNLNKEKLVRSKAGIVFSNYMSKMIGGGEVILHGAEPSSSVSFSQNEARKMFNLPECGRIALAFGFRTATKGWDIIGKMNIPEGWTVVVNSSKNHYNTEKFNPNFIKRNVVNLQRDFLTEEELSLLFSSADAVILPYTVSSGSGVMFDALAHGLPFIASNLEFFKEFSERGLGITVSRSSDEFSKGLVILDRDYGKYINTVESFRKELSWRVIASRHGHIYSQIIKQSIVGPSLQNWPLGKAM
jgi:glycosyltransferase involved in cell wall biosynthesis